MSHEFWTALSGALVSASGSYYALLVFLRRAPGNPISWGAWSIIGTTMFLTSNSPFGLNAITFGMINPIFITCVGAWRQYKTVGLPKKQEIIGGILALVAISAWLVATHMGVSAKWALGLSIISDLIPLAYIVCGSWEKPEEDAPFAWFLFGVGFGISAFGQVEWNLFTLALPVYMVVGSSILAFPLVLYRIRTRSPLLRWIY